MSRPPLQHMLSSAQPGSAEASLTAPQNDWASTVAIVTLAISLPSNWTVRYVRRVGAATTISKLRPECCSPVTPWDAADSGAPKVTASSHAPVVPAVVPAVTPSPRPIVATTTVCITIVRRSSMVGRLGVKLWVKGVRVGRVEGQFFYIII